MKALAVDQQDHDGNLPSRVPNDHGQLEHSTRVDNEGSGSGRGSNNPEMVNQEEIGARSFPKTDLTGATEFGAPFTEPKNQESLKVKSFHEQMKDDDGNKDEATTARSGALQHAVSQILSQGHVHHQQRQQQVQPQQGSVIRWERFLPQHQLRVLLVEDDDSTRHVVRALLRNCSYEVTSAANGLLAWEILLDPRNQIDLVLTEVVMPTLSGVGLLARIMSHEPLKHIPVIMMSSLDSMGIVFKCLSKGAVDFLVKPVRKNELKNLWQHIWRRCHSSSGSATGSGSGSGSRTQKAPQLGDCAVEANNSSSNNETENTSSELNIGGGSDNGSGTQSSWTKKAVEVESSHPGLNVGLALSSLPQGVQADRPKGENADTKVAGAGGGVADLVDIEDDKGHLGSTDGMAGEMTTGACDDDVATCLANVARAEPMNLTNKVLTQDQESAEDQQVDSEDANDTFEKHASNSPTSKEKAPSEFSSPSLLKLSLKRPCGVNKDEEHEVRGLKHSRSSAFSRYNNSYRTPLPAGSNPANIHATLIGFGDCGFVQGGSICSNPQSSKPSNPQIDRVPFAKDASEATAVPQFYTGIGHANKCDGTDPHKLLSERLSVAGDDGVHLIGGSGPDMQMHFSPSPALLGSFGSTKEKMGPSSVTVEVQNFSVTYRPTQGPSNAHVTEDPQFHHHHHHHHHHIQHHYHHHRLPDQPQKRPVTSQQEDSTLIEVGAAAPQCGSSNMVKGPLEGNNGQSGSSNGYGSNGNGAVSLNGSVAGSNNGSNGGQSAAVELGSGGNIDSGAQLEGMHGTMVPGPEQSRLSMREAALTKFRQKRKERCFEKKVRYQSRKRLAEQRPRVRGQFVRRSVS